MSKVVWKPIAGCLGYEVSTAGGVRSYWQPGARATIDMTATPDELVPYIDRDGRLSVSLSVGGRQRNLSVARLVLAAFQRQPYPAEVVIYQDGDKKNCAATNLRWGTRSELVAAAKAAGLITGEHAELTDEERRKIRKEVTVRRRPVAQVATQFGLSERTVRRMTRVRKRAA